MSKKNTCYQVFFEFSFEKSEKFIESYLFYVECKKLYTYCAINYQQLFIFLTKGFYLSCFVGVFISK